MKANIQDSRGAFYKYLIVLFAISFGIGGPCSYLLRGQGIEGLQLFTLVYTFMPAIATVFVIWNKGDKMRLMGFQKPRLSTLIRAAIVPHLYLGTLLVVVLLLYGGSIDLSEYSFQDKFVIFLLGPFTLVPFILGEEVGWRGYLQNIATSAFGNFKGILILGLVWGWWHIPMSLHGLNFASFPLYEAFIFYPIFCIALSLAIAYLGLGRSLLWTGVALHCVNNSLGSIIHFNVDFGSEVSKLISLTAVSIMVAIIFGWLYIRVDRNTQTGVVAQLNQGPCQTLKSRLKQAP